MKIVSIENIVDIQEVIKYINKQCSNRREVIEQRLEILCADYAMQHDCKVEFRPDSIIFYPEEMLSLPCIF